MKPTKKELLEIFEYKDGRLYWKNQPNRGKIFTGKEAGHIDVYRNCIGLGGTKYYRSKLIWVMHGGNWEDELSHKNNDLLDDRIENLEIKNHKHRNIYWDRDSQKWEVSFHQNKRKIHLGYFKKLETAIKVRDRHLEEKKNSSF